MPNMLIRKGMFAGGWQTYLMALAQAVVSSERTNAPRCSGKELLYKNQEYSHKTSLLTARMLAVRV
jgi:hypothetical protein